MYLNNVNGARLNGQQRKHYYLNAIDKIDRRNLKRKAQRLESYSTLLSKRRVAIFNDDKNTNVRQSSSEIVIPEKNRSVGGCNEKKDVQNKINGNTDVLVSPSSTGTGSGSSSSDESLEFMPAYQSFHKSMMKSNQGKFEATSVMTRSASRKYATVGALHNMVNVEEELKTITHWPENVSYPIPGPPNENELLKNTVSEAFFQVMTFCKLAKDSTFFSKRCSQETVLIPNENLTGINLSTHKRIVINENQNQISLKLKENVAPSKFINIMPLCEEVPDASAEEQDNAAYQSITLYPEPSIMLETREDTQKCNPYLSCDTTTLFDSSHDHLAIAVKNDHSYALRYNEDDKLNMHSPSNDLMSEFKLDDALNNLMFNTAVLKCLVCGEFPRDIASYLNKF